MARLVLAALVVSLVALAWIATGRVRSQRRLRRRVEGLRTAYLRKLQLPGREGRKVFERQLRALMERQPGRSRRWYLEKMLVDLDRSRR